MLPIRCPRSITLPGKLEHASLRMFSTFPRTLSAVSSVATGISSKRTHRRRPFCSKSSLACSSLVIHSWSSSIADLNSYLCFFMAFSTSRGISLRSSNFPLITLTMLPLLVSIGMALPDLVSDILKQFMTIKLKETPII